MRLFCIIWVLGISIIAGGCAKNRYASSENVSKKEMATLANTVKFEISDKFFRDPPNCAVVLASTGIKNIRMLEIIETSVSRHLSGKITRVVGPHERENIERKLAFDLNFQEDRKYFSIKSKCSYFIRVKIRNLENTYALVWSRKSIGLELALHGVNEKHTIWKANYQTSRSNGGLPISPISFGAAMINAGRASRDTEAFPSMIDDCFRKMFAELPDTRIY